MIEVGDIVQITNKFCIYTTFSAMASSMGIDDTWRYGAFMPLGVCIGKVIAINPHPLSPDGLVCAVLIDGQSYIIDEGAVEFKSKSTQMFDDDLFEL